jgi:hypothetical protein
MLDEINKCFKPAIRGILPKRCLCRSFTIIIPLFFYSKEATSATPISIQVNAKYEYDDNLFKMSDERVKQNDIRSDYSWSQVIFLGFDKTYSRQRVQVLANIEKVKFNRFTNLNYVGHKTDINWLWQLGNYVDGTIGISNTLQLPSYADVDSDQRNLKKTKNTNTSVAWHPHPDLIATARYRKDTYDYELLSQQYNNHDENIREIELQYIFPRNSTIGFQIRRLKAENFPRLQNFFESDQKNFTQTDFKLRANLNLTKQTRVDALLGRTSRTQYLQSEENSGITGRVHITRAAGAKLLLDASVWQEFAPLESRQATYSLNRGISIGTAWEISSKVTISADAMYERRLYGARDDPQRASDIRDYTRTSHLALKWAPRSSISFNAQLNHQNRTGTNAFAKGNFNANNISFTATFFLK